MSLLSRLRRILVAPFNLTKGVLTRWIFYRYQHLAYRLVFEDDIKAWAPDVVHCNDWQTLSTGAHLKEKIGSALIFDSHELETHRNPPLPPSRVRWMQNYEREHLPNCDFVSTVCEPIAVFLAREYKISKPAVVVNAPIHDPALRGKGARNWGRMPEGLSLRQEAGFSESQFMMVTVGNATINRGIETLLEAMALLPEDTTLAILGRATPAFADKLNQMIKAQGLEERASLVEPVNPTALVPHLSSADLGVIPLIPHTLSYEFALPNKLFECAFAGLPIVASDTFEVKRMIEKYDLGTTCPPGDPFILAAELRKAYDHWKTNGRQVKDNSRFIAEMAFEHSVQPTVDFLKSVH